MLIKNLFKFSPVMVAMACGFALHAQAQNAPEAGNSLKEVQVVNTSPLPGIGIEKNKLPYEVQTFNSATLRQGNSLNLSEFMTENLNGVNVNDIQGSPYQSDVTYRGFRASATLGASQGLSVYLDGVRVNEAFGDVVNWDMFPEAAFDNVTLVPGSNPIYGLNTLGGALAFTTKSGLTTQGNELGLSLGSFGRTKIDLTHGSKSADGWHRFIAGTAFAEKGWRDESAGSLQNLFVKVGRTQNDNNWDMSFLSGGSKLMGNGLTPSTNYDGVEDPKAAGVAGLYERNRKAVYSYPDETKNTTNLLTFNFQRVLDANTELSATAYVRRSKQNRLGGDVECDDTTGDGCDDFLTPDDTIEGLIRRSATSQTSYGVATNLTKIWDAHQVTAGAALDKSKSSYSATEEEECPLNTDTREVSTSGCSAAQTTAGVVGNSTALGLYLSDTLTLSPATHVTIAGRYNRSSVSNTLTDYFDANNDLQAGVVAAKESFTFKKFNPSLGLTHKLNDGLTVFGNLGQSNRVPTVIELGCADKNNPCQLPTGLQADPELKQVVSQTIEVGMRWRNERNYALAVSAYSTNNKNDILFTPSATAGMGYFANFSKTRYQGLDLSASKSWGVWSLRTQYSYLYATYQDTAPLMSGDRSMSIKPGTRMAGLPMNTLKLHLDWQASEKLFLGASTVSTSRLITQGNEDGLVGLDDETVATDASTKGYTLLNLSATYKAEKGLEYFGKINNALNKRYETYGLMAANNFALDGSSLNGTAGEQTVAKFVAPGATRSLWVGLRYKF
ncbi:MAG: TonB-dependent receptor [Burkholderiales bacterium]|nr:TonB-dependent receptor [Burkholderiales bacterium]